MHRSHRQAAHLVIALLAVTAFAEAETLPERAGGVTMKGQPVTLLGPELRVSDPAPAFTLTDVQLNTVTLSDYAGKVKVVSAVPSLDTPVCDLETRRFNDLATGLGENVVVLTVSMDLPFAQKR